MSEKLIVTDPKRIGKVTPDGIIRPDKDVFGGDIVRPFSTYQTPEGNVLILPFGFKGEVEVQISEPKVVKEPKNA